MRKNVIITSGLTLAAGIAGAFLRCREMNTVFEPGTGLPIKNAPVSMILIGLSILVIIAAAVYAFAAGKSLSDVKKDDAFNVGSMLVLAVVTVCGVIMALGALGNYILDTGEKELFRIAYLILGAASGVAIIMAALSAYREDSGNYAKLYILPTLFMCLWLVMTYKDNNTNPALVEYSYSASPQPARQRRSTTKPVTVTARQRRSAPWRPPPRLCLTARRYCPGRGFRRDGDRASRKSVPVCECAERTRKSAGSGSRARSSRGRTED